MFVYKSNQSTIFSYRQSARLGISGTNEMFFSIAESERGAKSRESTVYHFLITLLVPEL